MSHARLVAFGSTRKKGERVEDDSNIRALIEAATPVVAIVGKSSVLHVEKVLGTTTDENLRMIEESVVYLVSLGREVVYDAEHFFDGYKENPEYALATISAAARGGARWLVLCDTNGGTLPSEITRIVRDARRVVEAAGLTSEFGIHSHNDSQLAVANSIAAVEAGCRQIQGTTNGYGERCGNANLVSLIPTLQLKMKKSCVPESSLSKITDLSRRVAEVANLSPDTQAPYVGTSAFAHKGGIHVAAVEDRL